MSAKTKAGSGEEKYSDLVGKLTKQSFWSVFMPLAMPLIIQTVLTTLVSLTDVTMLGFQSELSLAASNLACRVSGLYLATLIAVCQGASILIAQYWGDNNKEAATKVLVLSLTRTFLGGVFLFLAALLFARPIMFIFSSDSTIIELGASYLKYVSFSYLFLGISQIYISYIRNIGMVKLCSFINVFTVVLNVILNGILIFGLGFVPAMGIKGAALATSIARGIELLIVFIAIAINKELQIKLPLFFKRNRGISYKFRRYTSPIVTKVLLYRVADSALSAIVGHLGTELASADATAMILRTIYVSLYQGYTSAAGIIIGQELGSKRISEAKEHAKKLARGGLLLSSIVSVLLIIFRPFILNIFPSLSELTKQYLNVMIIYFAITSLGQCFNTLMNDGILGAGGDTRFLMKVDTINMWAVMVPLGLIAAFVLKLPPLVVYACIRIDEYTKIIPVYKRYKAGFWARNLTKKDWGQFEKHENFIYKNLIENMSQGVIMLTNSGRIAYSNDAARKMLCMDDTVNNFKDFLHDGRNDEFVEVFLDALYQKEESVRRTTPFYTEAGCKYVHVSTMYEEDEDMKLGISAVIDDVTDIVNLERGKALTQNGVNYDKKDKSVLLTIVSTNYLAQTYTMINSFRQFHKDMDIVVLISDLDFDRDSINSNDFRVMTIDELDIEDIEKYNAKYSIVEYNTFVKPYAIEKLFEEYDKVLYLDSDMELYHDVNVVFELLDKYSIILTPHQVGDYKDNINTLESLRWGLYNLGFIGVRKNANTEEFLKWWGWKLTEFGNLDTDNFLAWDQKWCDLVPIFFDDVYLLKNVGYNVAFWNLFERNVTFGENGYLVNSDEPLTIYHYSHYLPEYSDYIRAVPSEDSYTPFPDSDALREIFAKHHKSIVSWRERLNSNNE